MSGDSIQEIAYRWQARLIGGDLDAEDRAALRAWLDEDDSHREAFERTQLLWARLGAIDADTLPSDYLTPPKLIREQTIKTGFWRNIQKALTQPRLSGAVGGGLAAAFVIVALFFTMPAPEPALYRTEVAELKDIALADGTVINLGAQSRISVILTKDERRVSLLAGQAFFDVASDPDLPFIVTAGEATVRVIGTEFAIRRVKQSIRIAVAEGEVAVARADTSGQTNKTNSVRLTAGEQLRAAHSIGLSDVTGIEVKDIGAWRTGELIYANASLTEIIADADRYHPSRITITDASVAALTMSAVFDSNDIDGMLTTLEEALPIRISRWPDGAVFIHGR